MSEESAQEKYDRVVASHHGGWGGLSSDGETAWRPDSPVAQEWAAAQYEQEQAAAQEPEPWADPEPYYDPEPYDPANDYLEQMVADGVDEELGGNNFDFSEHDAWAAERAQQQQAAQEVTNAESLQASVETNAEMVKAALGGRDLGECAPEFNAQVARTLEVHLGAAMTEHLAAGGSEDDFISKHGGNLSAYYEHAVRMVQEARATEQMWREARAHSRGGR
jgi:hypothetical protein